MKKITKAQEEQLMKAEKAAYADVMARKKITKAEKEKAAFEKALEKAKKKGAGKATTKREKLGALGKKVVKGTIKGTKIAVKGTVKGTKRLAAEYKKAEKKGTFKKVHKKRMAAGERILDTAVGDDNKNKGKGKKNSKKKPKTALDRMLDL